MCLALPQAERPPGVRVWDLPLRLTHWSLALLVPAAFISQKLGGNAMVWHGRFGLAILGLVVFRLLWGFLGSTHARFASFVRGPAAITAYLRGQWRGLGHNPLGAISVLLILATLAALAATGLFANDDIAFTGPLYALVGAELSGRLTSIHKLFEPALLLLVAAHVAAIAFYLRVRKDDLLRPMLTGRKETCTDAEPPQGGSFRAFLLSLAIALLTVWAASGALLTPPPPPPSSAPAW